MDSGAVCIAYETVESGMGADVTIVDIDLDRLHYLEEMRADRLKTLFSNRANVEEIVFFADLGWEEATRRDRSLACGVNVASGHVTYEPVADAHGSPYTPLEDLLGE